MDLEQYENKSSYLLMIISLWISIYNRDFDKN